MNGIITLFLESSILYPGLVFSLSYYPISWLLCKYSHSLDSFSSPLLIFIISYHIMPCQFQFHSSLIVDMVSSPFAFNSTRLFSSALISPTSLPTSAWLPTPWATTSASSPTTNKSKSHNNQRHSKPPLEVSLPYLQFICYLLCQLP